MKNEKDYVIIIDEEGFYKRNPTDKIWWKKSNTIGLWEFSFDKKTVYRLLRDYPHNLTREEKELFDKENPYWANALKDR